MKHAKLIAITAQLGEAAGTVVVPHVTVCGFRGEGVWVPATALSVLARQCGYNGRRLRGAAKALDAEFGTGAGGTLGAWMKPKAAARLAERLQAAASADLPLAA